MKWITNSQTLSPSAPCLPPTHQVVVLHGRCIIVQEGERVTGLDQVVVLRDCEDSSRPAAGEIRRRTQPRLGHNDVDKEEGAIMRT